MKQILITTLLSISIFCFSQEEIIFNDLSVNKKDIKVEKNISGFGFGLDYIRILGGEYMGYSFGSVKSNINYFHESRIGNTFTLIKSAGLTNAFYNTIIYPTSTDGYGNEAARKNYIYNLALNLQLEPRWYFDLRKRYYNNRSIYNNSGLYLSLPVLFSTDLLKQPLQNTNTNWSPKHPVIDIITPPTLGYRKSVGKHWLIEASIGYIPFRFAIAEGTLFVNSAKKIGILSADSFNSELKAAYTF